MHKSKQFLSLWKFKYYKCYYNKLFITQKLAKVRNWDALKQKEQDHFITLSSFVNILDSPPKVFLSDVSGLQHPGCFHWG